MQGGGTWFDRQSTFLEVLQSFHRGWGCWNEVTVIIKKVTFIVLAFFFAAAVQLLGSSREATPDISSHLFTPPPAAASRSAGIAAAVIRSIRAWLLFLASQEPTAARQTGGDGRRVRVGGRGCGKTRQRWCGKGN